MPSTAVDGCSEIPGFTGIVYLHKEVWGRKPSVSCPIYIKLLFQPR
jgi:hypothetical protein